MDGPGPVDTGWMSEEIREHCIRNTPLDRLGTSQDTAHLVGFLCSREGGWINGQLLMSNGGFAWSTGHSRARCRGPGPPDVPRGNDIFVRRLTSAIVKIVALRREPLERRVRTDSRIARIRRKLAKVPCAALRSHSFGEEKHQFRLERPLPDAKVAEFEADRICHGPENPELCHPLENGSKQLVTWSPA